MNLFVIAGSKELSDENDDSSFYKQPNFDHEKISFKEEQQKKEAKERAN